MRDVIGVRKMVWEVVLHTEPFTHIITDFLYLTVWKLSTCGWLQCLILLLLVGQALGALIGPAEDSGF